MRNIFLTMMLTVSVGGLLRAQAREATGDVAERVKAELMELEQEKVNCFSYIGENAGWSADWVKWHDADAIVHISDRLRSKAELMDELRSGMRVNLVNQQFNHVFHIYGDGEDGTTVVISMTSPGGAMSMYGIRHASGRSDGLGIDVWYKKNGRWWFIVHCPGTGEPEPPTGEAQPPSKAAAIMPRAAF